MSFLEQVQAATVTKGPQCSIHVWLDHAPEDVVRDFGIAVNSPVPSTILWKVMRDHGFTGNANAVQRHRRGECKCHELP